MLAWRGDRLVGGDLWQVDLDGDTTRLTSNEDSAVSRSGTVTDTGTALFTNDYFVDGLGSGSSDLSEITEFNPETNELAVLYESENFIWDTARWTDGTLVWAQSRGSGRTLAMRPAGDTTPEYFVEGGELTHLPEQNRVAVATRNYETGGVEVVAVGAGGVELGRTIFDGDHARVLAWSPNGEQLLVVDHDEVGDPAVMSIFDLQSGSVNELLRFDDDVFGPDVTAIWGPVTSNQ